MFSNLTLHSPLWLLALLALPVAIWLRSLRRVPVFVIPFAAAWQRPGRRPQGTLPNVLAALGLILLIAALARPQKVEDKREVRSQGYDIMLAIDLSTSMRAEDFERDGRPINRLQAIKPVIQAFIQQRPQDRIGMVIFAGRAYTLSPLTFDHDWLSRQTERLKLGMIEDGTAIGDGLGIALTRLEQAQREQGSKRQGAFVILMTDGSNNRGALDPLAAADIATSRGIPVYTIGAGREGFARAPRYDDQGNLLGYGTQRSDLDEPTMREIAKRTGGKYFRADDNRTATNAFTSIDRAQKIEFQAKSYLLTTELFPWLAAPGLTLLFIAALLIRTAETAGLQPGRLNTASTNS